MYEVSDLTDRMMTMHFLDGPWKGERMVTRSAAQEGHVIRSRTFAATKDYRVQWNSELFRWEAVTITDFGDDNAAE